MSWQVPGSHITCTLGVGCNETGICYAEAHGQPEQCGVTIMDGIDLTQIKPLTEEEADAIFGGPSTRERYDAAMKEILAMPFADGHLAEDIARYVALLQQRLRESREAQYRAESRIQSIRDNY